MSPLKIASQCGHAYLDSFLQASIQRPDTIHTYKDLNHGIKIAMVAKGLHHLLKARDECLISGIPCALITDLGWHGTSQELEGRETITALGIGPARRSEIDRITRNFRLED